LRVPVEEGELASKYVKVQVLSVLDTLMTTTYWLVVALVLARVMPGSIAAMVLAVSAASLLRPAAEPPSNHGVRFLLRAYMGLGRKGVVKFGKLYWSSVALNASLAGAVSVALLASWTVTHEGIFLWASMLTLSSIASLPAQLPALLLDDAAYFRVVLLSNFARYALLYIMWRNTVDPQPCFESFLVGSLIAFAVGIGYAAWKGIGPRAWDKSEVRDAVRLGVPAWLEGAGITIAKWGVVTAVATAAYLGLMNPHSPYYVFTALLAGSVIAAILSGWVNVFLIASKDQYLLPAKIVGLASGTAFPFAVYFTLSALHATGDVGAALLAGALLASLPVDLLESMLSGRAHAAMVPGGVKVLRMYALAQFSAPIITYGIYFGLVFTLGKTLTSVAIPYIAVRLLSLMMAKSASRMFLNALVIVVAGIIPILLSIGLALTLTWIFNDVLGAAVLSITLTLLNYTLTSILGRHLE